MAKYGLPYQGSKSSIAEKLINQLPSGDRFVDLFGGGGAMSHCARVSGKYNKVLYNEINPLLVNLFKDAIDGKYNYENFTPEFITREEFFEKKEVDGYVKYIWSFGNNGSTYLAGKDKEEFKKQAHNFVIFNNKDSLNYLENHFKDSYWWHIKNIYSEDKKKSRLLYAKLILKIEAIRVTTLYSQVVYDLYKDYTFEEFVNLKNIDMVKSINIHIPDIPEKNCKDSRRNLERLKRLEGLEQLQQLQQLEAIEITNQDYKDYIYQEGDVVYCDPPYENTGGYNKESFNHKEFYDWVATRDFPVYFSSYEISDDRFKVVHFTQKRKLMSNDKTIGNANEVLYWNGVSSDFNLLDLF